VLRAARGKTEMKNGARFFFLSSLDGLLHSSNPPPDQVV
jgi:hypothetical protein